MTRVWKGICIVAHAPHTGFSVEEIHSWWTALADATPSKYQSWEIFLLVDANARVGSEPSTAIGSHQAEMGDEKSDAFSLFAHSHNVFLPATFPSWQSGEGVTWLHNQGTWLRNDFMGLPLGPPFTHCAAWVSLDFDLSIAKEDHRAVMVEYRRADVVREPGSRSQPRRHLSLPKPQNLPTDWCAGLPHMPLSIDVHAHAARLESHRAQKAFDL